MRITLITTICLFAVCFPGWISKADWLAPPTSLLIEHGTIVDGTGSKRFHADVRVVGDTIEAVGKLEPLPGEKVIDASGLVVAPGFIDTLSHADAGIMEDPLAESQVRQGITTAIVGHDGASSVPLSGWFAKLVKKHAALNFASFVGHGTVRHMVMGDDYKRTSTPDEQDRMCKLVEHEMQAGALGLSSGLEYEPGDFADTSELIALCKSAAKYGGVYVSHVRDEGDKAIDAFQELIRIAREARIPANISHIKLASTTSWHKSGQVLALLAEARRHGLDITADVYPYTYWQSTITVLIPTEDWNDRNAWAKGLAEVGGPSRVIIGAYVPDQSWQGRTLQEIAATTHQDPVSVMQEIVSKTRKLPDGDHDPENIVVTAMMEDDVRAFVADPHIMFCSDGSMDDTHPRGAGTFPRVLGQYVRQDHAITLEQAVHKMTGLSAQRMSLTDRGCIARGMKADITLFNPWTVQDTATIEHPSSPPIGIFYVVVNGRLVLDNGTFTGERPGRALRHSIPTGTVRVAQYGL